MGVWKCDPAAIIRDYKHGYTLRQCAERHGIKMQRVHQIIQKHAPSALRPPYVKKRIIKTVALLALTLAVSALLPAAAGAAVTSECLSSLAEARAAHPSDHLAWSGPANDRCYFKGHKGDRSIGKLVASKPLPRKRPESAPPAMAAPSAPVQVAKLSAKEAIEAYALIHAETLYQRAAFPVLMPEALAQAKLREAGR